MENVGYCVRVQALEGYADKIAALTLTPDYRAVLAVKHVGIKQENPHYHIVIRCGIQPQAFRVRMKKLFPDGKGNQHMAITNWDGDDKALSYLFHEEPDAPIMVARKGISEEFLEQLKTLNKDILQKVAVAKTKASHTLEEDAFQHFSKLGDPRRITDKDIAAYMILFALRNDKYPPQPWLCRAMTYKVKYRLLRGNTDAEEGYANQLAGNIFPD